LGYKKLLNKGQKLLSKNRVLVKVAVKARNQANKVIAYSLASTHMSHENGEEYLIKNIASKLQVVIDVGANKGEWTMLVQKYTPPGTHFHLVEPGKEAYRLLQPLISQNLNVYNLGLSDSNAELNFYEEENAGEQSSFIISSYHQHYVTTRVRVQSLDDFCQGNGIPFIDFLKIDCEGFDYKVLLGAFNLLKENRIKYIQFEYGSSWKITGSTLKAAIALLNNLEYQVWAISSKGLKIFNVDFYGEYFEYSNFFASKNFPDGLEIQP
jgi:FkbM family methyltransferase